MIVIERTPSGDYAVFVVRNGRREYKGTFPSMEDAEAWAYMTRLTEVAKG